MLVVLSVLAVSDGVGAGLRAGGEGRTEGSGLARWFGGGRVERERYRSRSYDSDIFYLLGRRSWCDC